MNAEAMARMMRVVQMTTIGMRRQSTATLSMQSTKGCETMSDSVNKPAHYTQGDIECIDAMQAMSSDVEFEGYLRLSVIKYLWRWRDKGGIEDLRKARWYLDRLIRHVAWGDE